MNDLFFLAKACSPFRWKNPVDHSLPPSNLIRSPINWFPFMHPQPSSPEPHELIAIHASSTIESRAPWIDCHSCILHHRVWSPTNWLPSAVRASSTLKSEPHKLIAIHASSTIKFGAPWIDCLALFVHPPSSNLIRSPMNWLPFMHPLPSSPEPRELIAIHASSTIESGAPRIDCLALFMRPPPSNIIRSPMNWLSFMHSPPSSTEPHKLIA